MSSDKTDKVPEGMTKPPDITNVPKVFIQAYNYAIYKCRESNPGKAFTLDGFHKMLSEWSAKRDKEIEAVIAKGQPEKK